MGKSALDFDDIQAVENRRREVAVRAGASPRATKYEPSPLKELILKYAEETKTEAGEKLQEYQKTHPLPGYNFVATPPVYRNTDDVEKELEEQTKEYEKEAEKIAELLKEAQENEYKITDTSTGMPKAPPPEEGEDLDPYGRPKKWFEKTDAQRLKEVSEPPKASSAVQKPSTQPSPAGSGDIKSASAAVKK